MSDDRLLKLVGVALVAFIVIAVLTGVLAAMNPDIGDSGPGETEWSVDRVNETHVRITYEAGAPISTDRLIVSVDGYNRHVTWSGEIRPGDDGVTRAASDRVVRVYWTDGEGPRDRLAEWRV